VQRNIVDRHRVKTSDKRGRTKIYQTEETPLLNKKKEGKRRAEGKRGVTDLVKKKNWRTSRKGRGPQNPKRPARNKKERPEGQRLYIATGSQRIGVKRSQRGSSRTQPARASRKDREGGGRLSTFISEGGKGQTGGGDKHKGDRRTEIQSSRRDGVIGLIKKNKRGVKRN